MFSTYLTIFYTYQFRVTLWESFDIPAIPNQPQAFPWKCLCPGIQEFPDFIKLTAIYAETGH